MCVHRMTSHIINKEEGYEALPEFLWDQYQKTSVLDVRKGLKGRIMGQEDCSYKL